MSQHRAGLGILGSVVAVVSTSMDLSLPSTVAARTSLAAMHIVVGLAYVTALRFVESAPRTPVMRISGAPVRLQVVAA